MNYNHCIQESKINAEEIVKKKHKKKHKRHKEERDDVRGESVKCKKHRCETSQAEGASEDIVKLRHDEKQENEEATETVVKRQHKKKKKHVQKECENSAEELAVAKDKKKQKDKGDVEGNQKGTVNVKHKKKHKHKIHKGDDGSDGIMAEKGCEDVLEDEADTNNNKCFHEGRDSESSCESRKRIKHKKGKHEKHKCDAHETEDVEAGENTKVKRTKESKLSFEESDRDKRVKHKKWKQSANEDTPGDNSNLTRKRKHEQDVQDNNASSGNMMKSVKNSECNVTEFKEALNETKKKKKKKKHKVDIDENELELTSGKEDTSGNILHKKKDKHHVCENGSPIKNQDVTVKSKKKSKHAVKECNDAPSKNRKKKKHKHNMEENGDVPSGSEDLPGNDAGEGEESESCTEPSKKRHRHGVVECGGLQSARLKRGGLAGALRNEADSCTQLENEEVAPVDSGARQLSGVGTSGQPEKCQHFVYVICHSDGEEQEGGSDSDVTVLRVEPGGSAKFPCAWTTHEEKRLSTNWQKYFEKHPFDEPYKLLVLPEETPLKEKKQIWKISKETKFLQALSEGIDKPLGVIKDRAQLMFKPEDSNTEKTSTLSVWSPTEIKQLEYNWARFFKDHPMENPYELLSPLHFLTKERHSELIKFKKETFFLDRLGEGINRTALSVYHKAKRLFYPYTEMTGKLSEEEILRLKKLVTLHGKKLLLISTLMGRSPVSIEYYFKKFEHEEKKCLNGRWSDDETQRLIKAVEEQVGFSVRDKKHSCDKKRFRNLNWCKIAENVRTRDFFQCFQKWMYSMSSQTVSGALQCTNSDMEKLLKLVEEQNVGEFRDVDWLAIYEQFHDKPSPNFLKKLFRKMCRSDPNWEKKSLQDVVSFLRKKYREEGQLLQVCYS